MSDKNIGKEQMKKLLAAAVLTISGVAPIANAASVNATLVSVEGLGPGGPTSMIIDQSTADWVLDTETGVAMMTSGTFIGMFFINPRSLAGHIFTQTMSNGSIGGGLAATAATWSCSDGVFSAVLLTSPCGGYDFGPNEIDESIYTPTATGGSVILGGDDDFFLTRGGATNAKQPV
jgi:hypothetical protein